MLKQTQNSSGFVIRRQLPQFIPLHFGLNPAQDTQIDGVQPAFVHGVVMGIDSNDSLCLFFSVEYPHQPSASLRVEHSK